MGNFYSHLSYSFGNEDWKTEHKALKLEPFDRVLCVTASGDRPLNLLTADLQEIITIDANPSQNALFDLKKTALSCLSNTDYLAFMGVDPHKKRLETYRQLESKLDPSFLPFWEQQLNKIARGILYEGALEKRLQYASKFLRTFRREKINRLFSFDDLDEQRDFLDNQWNIRPWKKAFKFFLHPLITRLFIRDPGLYEHVDPTIHVGDYLFERLYRSLHNFLAKENIIASLCFKGMVDKNHLPPYLTPPQMEIIRPRLDRVRSESIDLISFLKKSPPNYFDCFSISDVSSYLPSKDFNCMIEALHNAAKPGARFCLRQFLSKHQIPPAFAHSFKRNVELEEELEKEDRCFVYRFMVGTIQK